MASNQIDKLLIFTTIKAYSRLGRDKNLRWAKI